MNLGGVFVLINGSLMQMILPHNFKFSAKEYYLVRESASRALFKPGRLVTLKCFLYRRKVFIWK